jgi:hypothetical protein
MIFGIADASKVHQAKYTCGAATASVTAIWPRTWEPWTPLSPEVNAQNTTMEFIHVPPTCNGHDFTTEPCIAHAPGIPPSFYCAHSGAGGVSVSGPFSPYEDIVTGGGYVLDKGPPPGPPMLYAFENHTFVNPKAYNRQGASASEFASAYSSTSWASDAAFFKGADPYAGYQKWTVPMTANYQLTAAGAQGGGADSRFGSGGYPGALIQGDFLLEKNEVLVIVVGSGGGTGQSDPHGNEVGGGGGTFVGKLPSNDSSLSSAVPLIVAGGGGGAPTSCSYGCNCGTASCRSGHAGAIPKSCQSTNCGGYGIGWNGVGQGGSSAGSYYGGSGAGWKGNGRTPGRHCGSSSAATSFLGGASGGKGDGCYNPTHNFGGFGGGGGGSLGGSGAGGGYTGGIAFGRWSSYSGPGYGGGSFNNGTSQVNTGGGGPKSASGSNSASGYVVIASSLYE